MSSSVQQSREMASRLASMVALRHTIFGLPFCLVSALLAHKAALAEGEVGLTGLKLLWIVLAFTGARTAAMAFNRIVDRHIDAQNPRTATRELPQQRVSLPAAIALTAASTLLFILSAAALGRLPLALTPLCLLLIFGYSLSKRWNWGCHLILGLALSLSPAGAWVGVRDSFAGWPTPLGLMFAVSTWVAGFDIIYSLQDRDFDTKTGLHSIPVRFGVEGALIISAALHLITIWALVFVHQSAELGLFHALGVLIMAALLSWEHWIVRPNDLSRIDRAFFQLNGYAALAYLLCTCVDIFR